MEPSHITLVASRFRDGGVERRINRLAQGLAARGVQCTLLLGEDGAGAAGALTPAGADVRVHGNPQRLLRDLRARAAEHDGPGHAVLAFRATDYGPVLDALDAARLAVPSGFLVSGAFISERLRRPGLRGWRLRRRVRRSWARAAGVLAISPEIAADWAGLPGFPGERVHHVHPPVVGADIDTAAARRPDHPWAATDGPPVILGVGRLVADKRFHLLLDAVARIRAREDVRLVILGRGPEEAALHARAAALGIADAVHFAGFTANPYAWMACARLLVLPSRHEPFGLVLIESLYTGTPFVAMEAARGPASIRSATGQGRLVAEADPAGLVGAIEGELRAPCDPAALRAAVARYETLHSAREHLGAIARARGAPAP